MTRFSAILIVFYYLSGTLFLPDGNFAYFAQIPELYRDYIAINGESDLLEFCDENFFDFEKQIGIEDQEEDEPFEKEAKQIPFHSLTISTQIAIPTNNTEIELKINIEKTEFKIYYLLKEYFAYQRSIFHPPKNMI